VNNLKNVKMKVSISSADWSYYPGEEVLLDDDQAAKWYEAGHCEMLEDVPEIPVDNVPQNVMDSIIQLGGGWYQVPDGNKFKGKNAAIEYLIRLGSGGVVDGGHNASEQTNAADGGTADVSNGQATP
jgi:hypothetical protein